MIGINCDGNDDNRKYVCAPINEYQEMMRKCKIPQMARGNLTLWVKSEGAFTATIQQWIDIIKLRDAAGAHPEAQKIAKMIEKVLVNDVGVEDLWGVKEIEENED